MQELVLNLQYVAIKFMQGGGQKSGSGPDKVPKKNPEDFGKKSRAGSLQFSSILSDRI